MADEMSDRPAARDMGGQPGVAAAINELPTLQRNALRRIFDRPQFTPAEVAELGYRRLQQAEGIGAKGLGAITGWLAAHGYQLPAPTPSASRPAVLPRKTRRTIEMAVRLLRTHGYEVQAKAGAATPAKER